MAVNIEQYKKELMENYAKMLDEIEFIAKEDFKHNRVLTLDEAGKGEFVEKIQPILGSKSMETPLFNLYGLTLTACKENIMDYSAFKKAVVAFFKSHISDDLTINQMRKTKEENADNSIVTRLDISVSLKDEGVELKVLSEGSDYANVFMKPVYMVKENEKDLYLMLSRADEIDLVASIFEALNHQLMLISQNPVATGTDIINNAVGKVEMVLTAIKVRGI